MRFWDIVMTAATQGGGAAADPDPLGTALAALEAAEKLVCAWYLPAPNPSQYLTLSGSDVTTWAAAYGTQKVDVTEATNKPVYDATLYSNKGGVTFDGTNDLLTGTGNVTNWPADTDDLYMLAAGTNSSALATKSIFAYGTNSALRYIGKSIEAPYMQAALTTISGTASSFPSGSSHTVGGVFDIGGTSVPYLDGVASGAGASTATAALTLSRVRLGAGANSTATLFWQGSISCAAILNSTASLSDFTALEALMRARVT